jgi:tRNA pseudouridine38-40 synthase
MRRISGALFEIGRGARQVEDAERILTQWSGMHLPVVLPARGLTLMKIRYGRHPRDSRERKEQLEEIEEE